MESEDKLGAEGKALTGLLNQYDNQIKESQEKVSGLTRLLYRAELLDRNIGTYNQWLGSELGMIQYGTGVMSMAAGFIPSGGASAGFFLPSTQIRGSLFSLRGGYGVFGKKGLRIGSYKIEAMYATPRVGYGTGTILSIKQVGRAGGNLLRWDYGILHGTQKLGIHSTFRFNMFGKTFGGTGQFPWSAPFKFWKY